MEFTNVVVRLCHRRREIAILIGKPLPTLFQSCNIEGNFANDAKLCFRDP
jgi:hypothetical protein